MPRDSGAIPCRAAFEPRREGPEAAMLACSVAKRKDAAVAGTTAALGDG